MCQGKIPNLVHTETPNNICLFQHPVRDYRGDLVCHHNLDCRPGILLATAVQDGAGRGRVEDEEQDGLLQVQLIMNPQGRNTFRRE